MVVEKKSSVHGFDPPSSHRDEWERKDAALFRKLFEHYRVVDTRFSDANINSEGDIELS